MYRYTCLNPIAAIGLDRFTDQFEKAENIDQADAVLVRSADMHEMDIPENILAIARAGAGVNNIPLEECAKNGVVVFNTPGANANGVKELVFAGMLLAARDIVGGMEWLKTQECNDNVARDAEKQKKKYAGNELAGKKLGVIGLGAIGAQVANTAIHFNMKVYGYDPYLSVDTAWNLSSSVSHVKDVEEIYKNCDYITIHVPLLDSTKGMIDRKAISMMKPTAVLLNYARDLLVDEEVVLEALAKNRLRRYVSDFPNTTTVGHPGVILTPHLGASTAESEDNCAVMAVKELMDFLENGNIRNSVNYPACSMGKCEYASRLAIYHTNTKKMLSQYTKILEDTNIMNMSNTSRGEYAYTLLDLDAPVGEEIIKKLSKIEGVIRIRVIK